MQIQDIHSKNKKEIQEANLAEALAQPEIPTAKTIQISSCTGSDEDAISKELLMPKRQLSQQLFVTRKASQTQNKEEEKPKLVKKSSYLSSSNP